MLHYSQSVIVTAIAVVYTGWGQEREGSFLRLNFTAFWKWREENLSLNKKNLRDIVFSLKASDGAKK